MRQKKLVPILVADDDVEDCQMIKEALRESRLVNQLHFVHNGEELMQYLNHQGKFSDRNEYPLPGLILLDLNMPKMDGREALIEIKGNPKLRSIPVIVLTTSRAEEDIERVYNVGVNSFITKPIEFNSLVQIMRDLGRYWFEIVELPENCEKDLNERK